MFRYFKVVRDSGNERIQLSTAVIEISPHDSYLETGYVDLCIKRYQAFSLPDEHWQAVPVAVSAEKIERVNVSLSDIQKNGFEAAVAWVAVNQDKQYAAFTFSEIRADYISDLLHRIPAIHAGLITYKATT